MQKSTRRLWPALIPVLAIALSMMGCEDTSTDTNTDNQPEMEATRVNDPHSFARPAEAVVKHLDLDIEVDFEAEKIAGVASWTIEAANDAESLILDTRDLNIEKVTLGEDGKETEFSLGEKDHFLGQPLKIKLGANTKQVNVHFATNPDAGALQWLKPVQTAGKKHPFLFTQSQAILARTWLPCQDGPGMRFTYSAKVKVDPALMAVMSASNPTEKSADGTYQFEMKQPIPAYLMALAVGDIVFEPVGERTGVYAEPSIVASAQYEFEDMEKMLEAAEELYGAYSWERYDVIVLPPSFPFGGMENPRLTFATPTILAGDKSLTALVAHELAHSWSGNLVTNATWDDFWLNEGFTVYFERRIMESLYGESYKEMLSVLGWQDLQSTLADLSGEPKDTHLKLDLENRDPDDGMTDIAYEKGNFFLEHIESIVGREKFDEFLKNYFQTNSFQVMTTEEFIDYLKEHLVKGDEEMLAQMNLDAWIYGPGLPEGVEAPTSERFEQVEKALAYYAGESEEKISTDEWTTHEWLNFIRQLPEDISYEKLAQLDKEYGFTNSGNSEIQAAWFMHTIRHKYAAADAALEAFLLRVGRRKFLKPLYKALAETPEGLERGRKIYAQARANYHSVSVHTLDEILKWDPS